MCARSLETGVPGASLDGAAQRAPSARRWTAHARRQTIGRGVEHGTRRMAGELTMLLQALERGDRAALDKAFALVYAELKRLARAQRRRGANDSFSTTALVHEVYVKFAQAGEIAAESREHFYSVAARAMRQVLLDRARAAHAAKRPHPGAQQSLDDALGDGKLEAVAGDMIDLDRALAALAALDARLSEVAELHLFA